MSEHTDKAALFAAYWSMLAPDDAPALTAEYRFAAPRKYRFDWAVVDARIAIEVDGGSFAYRGGRHASDTDKQKSNLAALLGWRVFHFSPQMLIADPQGCVDIVSRALGLNVEEPA